MRAIRFLLLPFAIFYDVITSIRNYLYDLGILRSTSFEIPIIVVGNLSVGGTGKSPQIEYLVRFLERENKVAVLSRGYKRKSKGFILLNNSHTVSEVGDEPLQFFKKFRSISVAVDTNRVHGIQQLRKLITPDIILLDDAFQHRRLKAGLSILLTPYDDVYTDDFVLPVGNLRESSRGAKRANIIVVTKCPEHFSKPDRKQIISKLRPLKNQVVFFSKISYKTTTSGSKNIELGVLADYDIVLVTGIANSSPLMEFLKNKNRKLHHLKFPDHHTFSEKDIERIQFEFNRIVSAKKLLLTTEKDYVRLSGQISELSFLEITTEFVEDRQEFENEIKSYCKINSK